MSKIYPRKFVGLHSHSLSIGDSIGYPQDHINFAIKNGMDALALTDHGHMNGFSHQYFHSKKLKAKGVNFKPIFGVESYYVDSLENWRKLYNEGLEKKQQERILKKQNLQTKKQRNLIGYPFAEVKAELDEGLTGGTVVENEEESKSNKYKNPINQRSHLVLLAKNREGLYALFKLVSESYIQGFYRYPRIDLELLKTYSKGNIIGSTACVAGRLANVIFSHQTESDWEKLGPNNNNFELIQKELKEQIDGFKWALGDENFYLELQMNALGPQHLVNQHLIEASKRTNTPLITTIDAHYSHPDHWREREIYKIMAWSSKGMELDKSKIPQKIDELKCELYPKNAEQVWESYKKYTNNKDWDFYDDKLVCESIERTYTIAHEQIDFIEPDASIKLPAITKIVDKSNLESIYESCNNKFDEDKIAFQELKRQAIVGMKKRGLDKRQEYIERLKYELKVVKHLKFSKYFLTYSKIMDILSDNMLTGCGRGSGAGSLLSYVLNITQVDPIKYNLLFERFLNSKKIGYPDIDSDISDRDKAIKLLAEHFGEENVISISNFNQLQLRSLVKDLCRLDGVPFDEVNRYTKVIENEAIMAAKKTPGFDAQQWVLTFEEAENKSPTFCKLTNENPELKKNIQVLFKQVRNVSRHAGGVIISDNPKSCMPLIKSGGVIQTPWTEGLNYRHLEGLGFLKFDILGLGTLRMFENCIRRILKNQGNKYPTFKHIKKWFYENMHPDNNPMDDIKVYKHVYWNGNFAGVFQFVQPPVQNFIKKMKPRNITDLAVATSLFRPGPLSISADKLYLNNRNNPDSIEYKHPMLKEVLDNTCGLIVFQEQLQLIYHKLAGVPLDETDSVRKAFTKKDISNKDESLRKIQELRNDFINKCYNVNNIEKDTSKQIFDDIEKFVSYAFNAAHATAYSINSYQCAWLLTYYPDEWIASYIDYSATEKGHVSGKESPTSIALGEAKGLGYKIGKPDINESQADYQVKNKILIPSFRALKHVGLPALREIREHRPYNTIEDILWNPDETWRHGKFNRKALSTLVKLEAFDSLDIVGPDKPIKNYRQLYYILVEKNDELKRACARKKAPQPRELLMQFIQEAQELKDWSIGEKIEHSEKLAGNVDMNLIITPRVREYLENKGIGSIDEWKNDKQYLWCIIKNCKVAKTKTDKDYLRLRVYGESGSERGCFVWGFNRKMHMPIDSYTLCLTRFKKTDFGLSTFFKGIEVLTTR